MSLQLYIFPTRILHIPFVSPARRERVILVAPGIPSGVTLFQGRSNSKTSSQFFWKIGYHIPSTIGMCKLVFTFGP